MNTDIERIHSGALSLLGILMAVFTYAFLEYKAEKGTAYETTLFILAFIIGFMVTACGVSAICTHWILSNDRSRFLFLLFLLLLVLSTFTPLIVWVFTPLVG